MYPRILRFRPNLKVLLAIFLTFFVCKFVLYNNDSHLKQMKKFLDNTNRILSVVHNQRNVSRFVLPDKATTLVQPYSNLCNDDGNAPYLLFMFNTAPGHDTERMTFRDVYIRSIPLWNQLITEKHQFYQHGESVKAFFFTGLSNNTEENKKVIEEAQAYGDTIIDDFHDSYYNLTLKTLRMHKWVEHNCPQARYFVRLDDDVHLNVPVLLEFLNNYNDTSSKNLIAGFKFSNRSVDDDPLSKWFTPKVLWTEHFFPDYVSGVFHILGSQIRSELYQNSLKMRFFHLEDVFLTGMVRERFTNVSVVNIPRISVYTNVFTSCYCSVPPMTAIHPLTPSEVKCFSKFALPNYKCCQNWFC